MRIVIPGGTGQLGSLLATHFHRRGDEVVVISRSPAPAAWRTAGWDVLPFVVDGADVVINLAGRNVNCRYGERNRNEILRSRVESTRAVVNAIAAAKRPPKTLLQASTATMYAHRFDAPNDEATGVVGGGEPGLPETWRFSIDVAKAWERVVDEAALPSTRIVKMRAAVVMSRIAGGPFAIFRWLARHALGGRAGDGTQWVSWIHQRDFVRAVEWLIEHDEIAGAVNIAAPHPLPNDAFMHAIRDACGVRFGIPGPKPLLEIAAFVHRTETELLLKSRYVVPGRLLDAGFAFEFPSWPAAAADLCHDGAKEW